jgi:hypothetical protein
MVKNKTYKYEKIFQPRFDGHLLELSATVSAALAEDDRVLDLGKRPVGVDSPYVKKNAYS